MQRLLAAVGSRPLQRASSLLTLAVLLLAATGASYLLGRFLPRPLVAAWLYLPFVLLATVRWGRGPGIGAALLAGILVLFVALEPLGQPPSNPRDTYARLILSTLGLIGVAAFVSELSSRSLAAERRLAIEAERAAAQQRQAAILDSISDILIGADRDWRYTYINAQAERLLGKPRTELIGQSMLEIFPRATSSPVYQRAIDAVEQQRTEQFEYFSSPFQKWFDVRIYPSPEGVSFFWTDITARKRDETAMRLMTEAGAIFAGSLDYETTLMNVARLAVNSFADWCVIDILESEGGLRRLAAAHHEPAREESRMERLRRYPPALDGPHPVARVLRSGRSELGAETPKSLLEQIAQDAEHLEILQALGSRSYIVAPLSERGRTLGAISFHLAEAGRQYGPDDVTIAEEVARRAAVAIDNALLYRQTQQAINVRDEFLASVSHDLRTPITSARGLTQLLIRQVGRLDIPERQRMLDSLVEVDRATKRMSAMVDELLDLACIEAGRPLSLHRSGADLVEFARQVAAEQQRRAPNHHIHVETSVPTLAGFWDPVRLERVLTNLLSNAVKYSPDGGDIAVSVRAVSNPHAGSASASSAPPESPLPASAPSSSPLPLEEDQPTSSPLPEGEGQGEGEDGWAELSVRDQGMGIPAADLPRIFERFHRGANVAGQIPGLGIGLAGAKQIVEQHGGSLNVESEEGKGSTFTMLLPLQGGDAEEE